MSFYSMKSNLKKFGIKCGECGSNKIYYNAHRVDACCGEPARLTCFDCKNSEYLD